MKHEEFDITTATPVKALAALGIKLPVLRKPEDTEYRARNVVLPTALIGDDFLSGY